MLSIRHLRVIVREVPSLTLVGDAKLVVRWPTDGVIRSKTRHDGRRCIGR